MRWWFRPRFSQSPSAFSENILAVEARVRSELDGLFRITDCQIHGRAIFYGGELALEPKQATPLLNARLAPLGYTPFLRRERGKVWIHALPLSLATRRERPVLNILLFVATVFTTLLSGTLMKGVDPFFLLSVPLLPFPVPMFSPSRLAAGVPFSFTLLGILGTHELGHYFMGRRHGVAVTLPYFIPVPPPFLVGTMGAFIRMRSPVGDRRALFDIAVAGPLAGLVLAVPALIWGLTLSRPVMVPKSAEGVLWLGDSLLTKALQWLVVGPLPDGMDISLHPIALAGWFGLFVTAMNLIPVGQSDGGHLVYAVLGKSHRLVSQMVFALLLGLGYFWPGWLFWALLLLLLGGFQHGPPLDDITQLDPRRRRLGYLTLGLFILLLPPIPIGIQ